VVATGHAQADGLAAWDPTQPAPTELPAPHRNRLQRIADRAGYPVFVAIELLLFFGLWEFVVVQVTLIPAAFLPPPSVIIETLIGMFADGRMGEAIGASAVSWTAGFGLAIAVGVTIGLIMGTNETTRRLISPIAWSFYSTPYTWLLPLLVIWFGFSAAPIIVLVFYSAVLPILLTTAAGAATVDPVIVNTARVFGARSREIHRKVTIPATLPFIATGIRLAVPTSFIAVLIGEYLAGSAGVGRLLAIATGRFKIAEVFAVIVVLVVLSTSMLVFSSWLERRFSPWRTTGRGR